MSKANKELWEKSRKDRWERSKIRFPKVLHLTTQWLQVKTKSKAGIEYTHYEPSMVLG